MESNREQSLGHDVSDCLIGKCSSIVFAEPLCALTKGSVLTLRHPQPGKYTCHQKSRGIKRIVERNFYLCARSQQFDSCGILIRSIVGDHPEDVILARFMLRSILLRI